jgi:hypothetical protein
MMSSFHSLNTAASSKSKSSRFPEIAPHIAAMPLPLLKNRMSSSPVAARVCRYFHFPSTKHSFAGLFDPSALIASRLMPAAR